MKPNGFLVISGSHYHHLTYGFILICTSCSINSYRKFSILLFSLDVPMHVQTRVPFVPDSLRIWTCRCMFRYKQIFNNNLTATRRNPIRQNSKFSTKLQHETNYITFSAKILEQRCHHLLPSTVLMNKK